MIFRKGFNDNINRSFCTRAFPRIKKIQLVGRTRLLMLFMKSYRQQYLLIMHLQQKSQKCRAMQQMSKIGIEMEGAVQLFHFPQQSSFLHHYASVQEITEVNGDNYRKQSSLNIFQSQNQIDYVDQFLWNTVPREESHHFRDNVNQTSTLMQKQNDSHIILQQYPSPPQKIEPILAEPPSHTKPAQEKTTRDGLSKDYRKNLAGYILKKVLRILISAQYRKKLLRSCSQFQVSHETLIAYCNQSLPKLFGPNSIYELFLISNEQERKMKEMLRYETIKILRRSYTLSILKEGRMRDFDAYIEIKNKGLLYFQQLMP